MGLMDDMLNSLAQIKEDIRSPRDGKYQPGHYAPDPEPIADVTASIPSFKPDEGFKVDPVPARSI